MLDVQITSFSLSKTDRTEFIETANSVFETVMWRLEPYDPELSRKLWSVEKYVFFAVFGLPVRFFHSGKNTGKIRMFKCL